MIVNFNPVILKPDAETKHSKRTIKRRIKTCCKFNSHELQRVKKYDIEHYQCVNCKSRFFDCPDDRFKFVFKAHYDDLTIRAIKIFKNAFKI